MQQLSEYQIAKMTFTIKLSRQERRTNDGYYGVVEKLATRNEKRAWRETTVVMH